MEQTLEVSEITPDYNYLVLGHRGFLGKLILEKLESLGKEVRTIDQRLTVENVQSLLVAKIDPNTRIFNCIASGVTPNTGDKSVNFYTNFELLKSQLEALEGIEFSDFLHFASYNEGLDTTKTVISRSHYINSKLEGSNVCRSYMEHDYRIKLMHLPTVIDSTQPKGRFFTDFIHASLDSKQFQINSPEADLQMITFRDLWIFYESLDHKRKEFQSTLAPRDVIFTVYGFAKELNIILIRLGLNPVEIILPEYYNLKVDMSQKAEMPIDFLYQLENSIKLMLKL
jgi:nucleoside-diphosphate-sugar epimerase